MSGFAYIDGTLAAEGVGLDEIAAAVGTPFYCYSSAALVDNYQRYAAAFAGQNALVCYALKANSNQAVIRTFAGLGAGADVVSAGELKRALAAGVPPGKIVFAGVGKTPEEMAAGLDAGILQFNVESREELALLSTVALAKGRRAAIAIRVNPNVDAATHAKITTGKAENKFGIAIDEAEAVYAEAARLPGIEACGISVHIGSQLTDLAPYRAAFRRLAELARALTSAGHGLKRLDLGGGLGISYRLEVMPTPADYAAIVKETLGGLGLQLILEPGRYLVGAAGVLVARVVYVKSGASRKFLILDAAMNDLIRPALYDAYHGILPIREPATGAVYSPMDIVGPVCESSDTFATQRPVPPLGQGDLVAFLMAGAYGAVMASTYNSRPLVPEVLVNGSQFALVRPRPTLEELIALDRMPAWLEVPGIDVSARLSAEGRRR
jgi:diaminopimelate decarboxylase